MPKSNLYLQRSKYYIHRIDAAGPSGCVRRLLVPHEFDSVTEARQFMNEWKGSYYARKPAYSGFLIDRGNTLIDAAPLPLEPYIPAAAEPVPA